MADRGTQTRDINEAFGFGGWTAAWDESAGVWHLTHEQDGPLFDVAPGEVDEPFIPFFHAVMAKKRAALG